MDATKLQQIRARIDKAILAHSEKNEPLCQECKDLFWLVTELERRELQDKENADSYRRWP